METYRNLMENIRVLSNGLSKGLNRFHSNDKELIFSLVKVTAYFDYCVYFGLHFPYLGIVSCSHFLLLWWLIIVTCITALFNPCRCPCACVSWL